MKNFKDGIMKVTKLFPLLITFTTLNYFTPLNAQWYEKSNGLPNILSYANAIDAFDSLIATGPFTMTADYIPDSLYVTTDGGNRWYPRPLPTTLTVGEQIEDISIIGENKIWFSAGNGKIFHSSDGGFNWQLQFYDTLKTDFIGYIEMFDSLNGMAMGGAPANDKPALLLKTTDGGGNWISQNENYLIGFYLYTWRRVDFVDINTGYFFFNGGPQELYKTTNSGKDWEVFNDTLDIFVLKAYDENLFLAEYPGYNSTGTIHRTTDGGQNWYSNTWNFLDWGADFEFVPNYPTNVWYASDAVSFSNDSGKTWVEEFRLDNYFFQDIVFTDKNNGWLLANWIASNHQPRIFRTTNGGMGGIVSVDSNNGNFIISDYILEQNYPNPFNPITTIKYQIPELNFVTLKIFDVLGNEIAILVNEEKPTGSYEVGFNASTLPSGIYFYRLQAGSFVETKKMVLLR